MIGAVFAGNFDRLANNKICSVVWEAGVFCQNLMGDERNKVEPVDPVLSALNRLMLQPGAVHFFACQDPNFEAEAVHDCPHPFAEQVLVLHQQVRPKTSPALALWPVNQ